MILKVTKHAPHRWLSLNRSLGVVIRLWHQLRKVSHPTKAGAGNWLHERSLKVCQDDLPHARCTCFYFETVPSSRGERHISNNRCYFQRQFDLEFRALNGPKYSPRYHWMTQLFFQKDEEFSLDYSVNRDGILQLYSLMEPVVAITRDGQHGSAPMTAEMHMALSKLKATTLNSDRPLKVSKERFICFRCSCNSQDELIPHLHLTKVKFAHYHMGALGTSRRHPVS